METSTNINCQWHTSSPPEVMKKARTGFKLKSGFDATLT